MEGEAGKTTKLKKWNAIYFTVLSPRKLVVRFIDWGKLNHIDFQEAAEKKASKKEKKAHFLSTFVENSFSKPQFYKPYCVQINISDCDFLLKILSVFRKCGLWDARRIISKANLGVPDISLIAEMHEKHPE